MKGYLVYWTCAKFWTWSTMKKLINRLWLNRSISHVFTWRLKIHGCNEKWNWRKIELASWHTCHSNRTRADKSGYNLSLFKTSMSKLKITSVSTLDGEYCVVDWLNGEEHDLYSSHFTFGLKIKLRDDIWFRKVHYRWIIRRRMEAVWNSHVIFATAVTSRKWKKYEVQQNLSIKIHNWINNSINWTNNKKKKETFWT